MSLEASQNDTTNSEAPTTQPENVPQETPSVETSTPEPEVPEVDPEAPYGRNKDGTPAKKRGRKKQEESPSDQADRLLSVTPTTPRVKTAKPMPITPAIVADYEAMGQTAATLWFGAGTVLLGQDWAPNTEQKEHLVIKDAFRDYFKSTGATQFPPGVALCIALTSYAAVRIDKPTVKSRFGGFVSWIKTKLSRR